MTNSFNNTNTLNNNSNKEDQMKKLSNALMVEVKSLDLASRKEIQTTACSYELATELEFNAEQRSKEYHTAFNEVSATLAKLNISLNAETDKRAFYNAMDVLFQRTKDILNNVSRQNNLFYIDFDYAVLLVSGKRLHLVELSKTDIVWVQAVYMNTILTEMLKDVDFDSTQIETVLGSTQEQRKQTIIGLMMNSSLSI